MGKRNVTVKEFKIEWLTMIVAILLALIPAVAGYGILTEKVDTNTNQLQTLPDLRDSVHSLDTKFAVLDEKINTLIEQSQEIKEELKEVRNNIDR